MRTDHRMMPASIAPLAFAELRFTLRKAKWAPCETARHVWAELGSAAPSRILLRTAAVLIFAAAGTSAAAPPKLEKVSDHFYYFRAEGEAVNTGVLVTDDGILLVDPPGETGNVAFLEALRRVSSKPVRWVVHTDFHQEQAGGAAYFTRSGASVFHSKDLRRLSASAPKPETQGASADRREAKAAKVEETHKEAGARWTFGRQMRLFPGGIEVRVFAVQHKAHTGGDVVVYVPAEKVLQTGDLFTPGSLPQIDSAGGEGSASGWIDGLKQVIDAVPLLKPAIVQPRVEAVKKPAEEKTLEELFVVIPGHGPQSNMQEMKDLLESAVRLRSEMARAIAAGRGRESVLVSPAMNPYRTLNNFESFAPLLFDALPKGK